MLIISLFLSNIGLYECTLKGQVIDFIQEGHVTGGVIREAPVVRLHSRVNVKCQGGQIQKLDCCVQFPYKVKWFQDETLLPSSTCKTKAEVASVIKQVITALLSVPRRVLHPEILLHCA